MLRRIIKSVVPRPVRTAPIANTLRPDAPFTAVGDIHGRSDLLVDILRKIDPDNDQQLVFLGDYVDRGPDTAGTLALLHDLSMARPDGVICLLGNHERMLLQFLDDPMTNAPLWLQNGGAATLDSFGIACPTDYRDLDAGMALCDAFEDAVSKDLIAWLRQRPLSWRSGNIWCVHAAMDPRKPAEQQHRRTMLWGHTDFMKVPRHDGICVVHGHTRVPQPQNQNSRIAIDTGAYETGRLTAAMIAPDSCTFIQTGP